VETPPAARERRSSEFVCQRVRYKLLVSHRHTRHDTTRHTPGPTPALTITLPSSEHPKHTAARAQGPPLLETHPWARGLGVTGGASERAYEHWAHPTVARKRTHTSRDPKMRASLSDLGGVLLADVTQWVASTLDIEAVPDELPDLLGACTSAKTFTDALVYNVIPPAACLLALQEHDQTMNHDMTSSTA
jgi:hypothetical protein